MKKNLCKCVNKCERQGPNYFCPYIPEVFGGPGPTCKLLVDRKLLNKKPWWKFWS